MAASTTLLENAAGEEKGKEEASEDMEVDLGEKGMEEARADREEKAAEEDSNQDGKRAPQAPRREPATLVGKWAT